MSVRIFHAILVIIIVISTPVNAAQENPDHRARAYYFQAETAARQGKTDEALALVAKAKKLLGSSNALLSSLEVKILYFQKKYSMASQKLNEFYRYDPAENLQREMAQLAVNIEKNIEIEKARSSLERRSASVKTSWEKAFDISSASIVAYPTGGFAIVGTKVSKNTTKTDIVLIRVDDDGSVIWEKRLGSAAEVFMRSILVTREGGFLILGSGRLEKTDSGDIFVFKTDLSGNLLWDKKYGGGKSESSEGMVRTPDGAYAILGSTRSKGFGARDIWLFKISVDGTMIWDRVFGGIDKEEGAAIALAHEGGFVLYGSTHSKGNGNDDAWLLRTDETGNLLWEHTYGGDTSDSGRDIAVINNGGYALAGTSSSDSYGVYDSLIMITDSRGNKVSQKRLSNNENSYESAHAVISKGPGQIIAAGTESLRTDGEYGIWIMAFDYSLNPLWSKKLDVIGPGYGVDIVSLTDETFLVMSRAQSKSSPSAQTIVTRISVPKQ